MKWDNIKSKAGWLLVIVFLMGLTTEEVYRQQQSREDRPLAYVRRYRPNVNIFPLNISADMGEPVYHGDTLRTDDVGYAAVQFMDRSIAKVKPNSELIVQGEVYDDKTASTRIALEAGEIFMEVIEQSGTNFEVATSRSVASVKGTEFGVTDEDYVWVEEGIVEFTATISGEVVSLRQSMYGQLNNDNSITTGELTSDIIQQLRDEFEELAGQTEPQQLQLRFRDENGQIREINLDYYENE